MPDDPVEAPLPTASREGGGVLARVITFALDGFDARQVWVEVDVRAGLPAFNVVGLGDKAVREARERVHAAILNQGFAFPQKRITANLAPAYLRKTGPSFDLPLALGVLAASEQLPRERLDSVAVFGELSLSGDVRPARGTLAVAEGARREGVEVLVLARERADEAALVDGLVVGAVTTLREAVEGLREGVLPPPPAIPVVPRDSAEEPDLADVEGQPFAVHALTVAAAGGHNLLMQGPPGTGKTMLARRLPGILPPLTNSEALEVTRVHSVAGLRRGPGLVTVRPFRAPHHGTSPSGLVGGGSAPEPGEASLAHHGVLFLDELAEFPRPSLEALRQPLEDGHITVVRGQHAVRFPTRFQLVAATNPCLCGAAGTPRCRCTEADHLRYRRRLSGPLLDRIDLVVTVDRPVLGTGLSRAGSSEIRERVLAARERQERRSARTGASANARLELRVLRREVGVSDEAEDALSRAYALGKVTARGRHRVLRVALTLADLAGRDGIDLPDVTQALAFRGWAPAEGMAA